MTVTTNNPLRISSDPFDRPKAETVRFTMYRRLRDLPQVNPLPEAYKIHPWSESLIPACTAILRVATIKSPESQSYPQLTTSRGCKSIIEELSNLQGFLPQASWVYTWHDEPCAAILSSREGGCQFGQIQLAVVVPRHRRTGLASNLVRSALWEFNSHNLPHAITKVSRSNRRMVRFFREQGFQVNAAGVYI